jgi:hypothetical protein
MKPTNTHLVHVFLGAIVTTHLLNYTKTHTDDEVVVELKRLAQNPDDIVLDLDSFIADQCTSEESIKSFRQTFPDTDLGPADVARQMFELINKFDPNRLRLMKRLAIIAEVNDDSTANMLLAATIHAEIGKITEQAAALN